MPDSSNNLVFAKPLSSVQRRHRLDAAAGYLMLGMTDHALRELNAVDDQTLPSVRRLRGEVFREQCRHEDALREFETLLQAEPSDLTAAIGKAWCLKRLSRLEDAIDALRDAAASHPREALIQYNLACYFALADDKPRCLSHLGIALRLGPQFVELVEEESDFDSIRADGDFQSLIHAVAKAA